MGYRRDYIGFNLKEGNYFQTFNKIENKERDEKVKRIYQENTTVDYYVPEDKKRKPELYFYFDQWNTISKDERLNESKKQSQYNGWKSMYLLIDGKTEFYKFVKEKSIFNDLDGTDCPFAVIRGKHLKNYFFDKYIKDNKWKEHIPEHAGYDEWYEMNKWDNIDHIDYEMLKWFEYALGRDMCNGVTIFNYTDNQGKQFMYSLADLIYSNWFDEYIELSEG